MRMSNPDKKNCKTVTYFSLIDVIFEFMKYKKNSNNVIFFVKKFTCFWQDLIFFIYFKIILWLYYLILSDI